MPTTDQRRHLTLVQGDAPATVPAVQPKQHPQGVWDLPAATGHRRIAAVGEDGNLAIELNMTERLPESVKQELWWALERALAASLQALKV